MTLADRREQAVRQAIEAELRRYSRAAEAGRKVSRRCAWCDGVFVPRHRWHFLCDDRCRRGWYGGQFRPRHEARARRRAA